MKRTHITLPSLQVAATAFLALTCQAELYCVDKKSSEVVAAGNCDGDVEDFTTVEGAPGAALGAVVAKRQSTDDDTDDDDDDIDSKFRRKLELIRDVAARVAELKLVAGGFGHRDSCRCSSSSGNGGNGGSGGSGGHGGGYVVGTGGRFGGSRGG
jgi:uncharacterized membrane protein YgcG